MKIEIDTTKKSGLYYIPPTFEVEIEDQEILDWITENKRGNVDFLFQCVDEGAMGSRDVLSVADKLLNYLESHDPDLLTEIIEKYN